MTPEEEAYAEARRCIREANATGALDLDLSQLALNRLPRELGRLTSFKTLDVTMCKRLSGPVSAGRPRFPPIAQPLLVPATQRRPVPHWPASTRSVSSTWMAFSAFAGLPRSNPCCPR